MGNFSKDKDLIPTFCDFRVKSTDTTNIFGMLNLNHAGQSVCVPSRMCCSAI